MWTLVNRALRGVIDLKQSDKGLRSTKGDSHSQKETSEGTRRQHVPALTRRSPPSRYHIETLFGIKDFVGCPTVGERSDAASGGLRSAQSLI